MRLFNNPASDTKTYATQANAEKALRKAAGPTFDGIRWMIGVNSEGRFFPVVLATGAREGIDPASFIHAGICVAG